MVAGDASVREAILIILSTPIGSRVMNYEFGCRIHELLFAPNNHATHGLAIHYVEAALRTWEPRIEVQQVDITVDPPEPNLMLIDIRYTIRTLNTDANLVYPFYLQES